MCHNRAGAYYCAVSYGDTRKNDSIAADPYVVANRHSLGPFVECGPGPRVKRMAGGVYADIWAYKNAIAESDAGLVEYRQVEICEKVVADADVTSVVSSERLVDVDISACRA